ncbi:MAG: STAS domain-containing protein, partial [Actinomycetota bacterium]
ASTSVILDATDVTFMDSTGLHALIEGKRTLHEHGSQIFLVPSPQVQRVLELVFPDPLFASRLESVDEALSVIDQASAN